MSALSVIGSSLMHSGLAPFTQDNGGSSRSNANDTSSSANTLDPLAYKITTKDRAGAGILTVLILCGIVGSSIWIIL